MAKCKNLRTGVGLEGNGMTDSENLTALLMAGAGDCLGKGGALNCSKLADYLLEHGVIVLPCKVGDKLFILYDDDYGEYECSEFCIGVLQELRVFAKCGISGYKNIQECPEYYCGQPFCSTSFTRKDFGKTVFLTREEAEKALNERE